MLALRKAFFAVLVALLADLIVLFATSTQLAPDLGTVVATTMVTLLYAVLIWSAAIRKRAENRAANLTTILLLLPLCAGAITSGILVALHRFELNPIPMKWRPGSDSWAAMCLAATHVAVGSLYILLIVVFVRTRPQATRETP